MSEKPVDPNRSLEALRAEGYEAEVRQQHLLVHSVPYVSASRVVKRGTLICTYLESGGAILPPDNHQVWFCGEYPCMPSGAPLEPIRNESVRRELAPGLWVDHRFSNKPEGVPYFSDHFGKMVHYARLLGDQARVVERTADARTGKVFATDEEESVFRYADTASARSETLAVSLRLAMPKVAIVGLGGTGAYVLDQIAKTPVTEIHLFDGDEFLQHNAFRAPGAATIEELAARSPKTDYYRQRYDRMRRGIHSHTYHVDDTNVSELAVFNFIFLCVDVGSVRSLVAGYAAEHRIPLVDVGMSLEQVPETQKLIGTCRVTLITPERSSHFARYASTHDDIHDALYRRNIQIADLNALNAMMAVIKWKQFCGFYQDDFVAHHGTYSIGSQSMTRAVMAEIPDE